VKCPRDSHSTVVILQLAVGLLPLAVMFWKSLAVGGHPSLEYYHAIVSSGRALALLGNSLKLALWTSVLVTAVGIPLGLGVLLGKTDMPGRGVLALLILVASPGSALHNGRSMV
jgi:ABC-type Fe3+ transport system permease subunit